MRRNLHLQLHRHFVILLLPDLLAEAGSVDQTMTYVFETPPLLEAGSGSRILSFWNTNADTDTMITLWNHCAQAEDFVLTFYHQEGQYKLPIHLPANGSTTLSMASLIKGGQPDADGKTIPTHIVQGSGKLTSAKGDLKRLHVSMHVGVFNVRTGTCTCICALCDPYEGQGFSPSEIDEAVNGLVDFYAFVCTEDNCFDVTNNIDLHSNDTSIADIVDDTLNGSTAARGNAVGFTVAEGDDQIDTFDKFDGSLCGTGGFSPTDSGFRSEQSICGTTQAGHFVLSLNVVATPTNFRQDGPAQDIGNGDLHFVYRWDSTSGNLADLSNCVVGEQVQYPNAPTGINPLPPPLPPNPFSNPTNASKPATLGVFTDDQKLGANTTFVQPFFNFTLASGQFYFGACSTLNNSFPFVLAGPFGITRTVAQNPGTSTWFFVVTKFDSNGIPIGTATINPIQ